MVAKAPPAGPWWCQRVSALVGQEISQIWRSSVVISSVHWRSVAAGSCRWSRSGSRANSRRVCSSGRTVRVVIGAPVLEVDVSAGRHPRTQVSGHTEQVEVATWDGCEGDESWKSQEETKTQEKRG